MPSVKTAAWTFAACVDKLIAALYREVSPKSAYLPTLDGWKASERDGGGAHQRLGTAYTEAGWLAAITCESRNKTAGSGEKLEALLRTPLDAWEAYDATARREAANAADAADDTDNAVYLYAETRPDAEAYAAAAGGAQEDYAAPDPIVSVVKGKVVDRRTVVRKLAPLSIATGRLHSVAAKSTWEAINYLGSMKAGDAEEAAARGAASVAPSAQAAGAIAQKIRPGTTWDQVQIVITEQNCIRLTVGGEDLGLHSLLELRLLSQRNVKPNLAGRLFMELARGRGRVAWQAKGGHSVRQLRARLMDAFGIRENPVSHYKRDGGGYQAAFTITDATAADHE